MIDLLSNEWISGIGVTVIGGLILYYVFGVGKTKKQKVDKSYINAGVNSVTSGNAIIGDKTTETKDLRSSPSLEINPKYISSSLSGRVSFNYSNNNGVFIIGSGLYLFETKWSKAGDISIHAYNDLPSVDKIALVHKSICDFKQIKTTVNLDFSSRTRTVNTGQILVIKNKNNIFAAIKIIDIKDDSRGEKEDNLTFEYNIQINGSDDFSG